MLSGTADLATLAHRAPTMDSLDGPGFVFEDAAVLQASFEMDYSTREPLLPAGLHPTTPPLLVVLVWKVPGGTWGPFTMVQVRVSCRSGVRPRNFVAGCIVDSDDATAALRSHWGLPAVTGTVGLDRYYDSVRLEAAAGPAPAIVLTGVDPDPLGPTDAQYTVTSTLAHTPRGLRLVQVEPEYEMRRVERVRPRLEAFDGGEWGETGLRPRHPVSATIAVGTITVPPLRYLSRPDVSAFEGTERI